MARRADETGGAAGDLEALKRDYERFAASGNADGLAALYAEDAVRMPPAAPPVAGRDAIRREWVVLFQTLTDISDTGRSRFVVSASADVAYEIGEYRLTARRKNGTPVTQEGRYVTTFRRIAGSWRISAEIWHPKNEEGK